MRPVPCMPGDGARRVLSPTRETLFVSVDGTQAKREVSDESPEECAASPPQTVFGRIFRTFVLAFLGTGAVLSTGHELG